ncbi:MAG: M24 family metallopeptidase [Solirubrobacterales bacterium]
MKHERGRARGDLGRFAHGQFRADYADRGDIGELREQRVAKLQAALAASELDALLLFKDENVRYATGMRGQILNGKSALLNGVLVRAEGPPVLLNSGGDFQRTQATMTWIEEFHPIPILEARGLISGSVSETIAPLLSGSDLGDARIGLDEASFITVQELGGALPGLILDDGDSLLQECRRVKLPQELVLMEEAAAIAEAVNSAAENAVRPGVRETDVAAEAMHTLYRLGGEMAHVATPFVASGEHMSPPNRLATDKIIREGDIVFIDIGAMWNGYFSDVARTVICGKPSRRQQEVYTAVYESLVAGTDAMKVGNTNDDVAKAITEVGERHGLAENFITLFIGHGIGIGSNEPPYVGEELTGAETVTLEAGMTMALEPLIWVEGVKGGGGVRLEDTILVEAEGGRPLTRCAFDERLLV